MINIKYQYIHDKKKIIRSLKFKKRCHPQGLWEDVEMRQWPGYILTHSFDRVAVHISCCIRGWIYHGEVIIEGAFLQGVMTFEIYMGISDQCVGTLEEAKVWCDKLSTKFKSNSIPPWISVSNMKFEGIQLDFLLHNGDSMWAWEGYWLCGYIERRISTKPNMTGLPIWGELLAMRAIIRS